MDRTTLIRTAALMVPACWTAVAVAAARPSDRLRAGLMLAFLWNLPALVVVNRVAQWMGWWQFAAEGGLLLGMPVDLLLGWALLWGPLAALGVSWLQNGMEMWSLRVPQFFQRGSNIGARGFVARLPVGMIVISVVMVMLDLVLMPACTPVVQLGPGWLVGETVAVIVCLVPGLLFARWTEMRTRLAGRAVMQFLTFLGVFIFLLPAVVIEMGLATLPAWSQWDMVWAQVIVVLSLPGVSAMQEFVRRGRGTPFPYDPPERLVMTGPYAYVRNPMQLSNTLLFVGLALLLRSPVMVGAVVVSFVYSAGLAWWHEKEEMVPRWGNEWRLYRANVRNWVPRWRPWRQHPAQLYVAASCEICQSVRAWMSKRKPVGLEILPAEEHPERDLFRITYRDGEHAEDGIAAVGRALEHLHLGWAMLGFLIRLPVVRAGLQVLSDGAVAPPRRVGSCCKNDA